MAKKNITPTETNEDDDLEAVYQSVMTCQPALLPSMVEKLSNVVKDNEQMGIPWRVTSVMASKDGEFFRKVANDAETAKTMAAMIDGLISFSQRLEMMKGLADTVINRLLVAGCNHEKFNDWMKEAA